MYRYLTWSLPEKLRQGSLVESERPIRRMDRIAKRGFDIIAASSFLILFSPLLIALAIVLWALQGQPVLIKHRRLGRAGRSFGCYKFRTMVVNAEQVLENYLSTNPVARAEWDAARKLKADPRVTRIGHQLRRMSVDELPQIFNVLRGEMSLVGPRPIVDSEVGFYGPAIQHYYRVRPGLTGPWQVSGRSDTTYELRVKLDVNYAQTSNFLHDMAILLKTVPAVLSARGSY